MNNTNTQKMLETLRAQLARIEADLAKGPASADGQALVLQTVLDAGGHLSVADIMTRCKLTKGTAWRYVNALERDAKVWLRVTHGADGGRKHTIVYHADHVAA